MLAPFPLAAERYESFRNALWSQARPLVSGGKTSLRANELEIQAGWFGGEFGRSFVGTEGEQIEIVQFGHWNRGAGPDFTECALKIDGTLHRGDIEIDLDVRNWEEHGHSDNPAFNQVILHVFTDLPALRRVYTRTEQHGNVTQLLLPQYTMLQGPPDFLPEAFPGRCLAPLSRMDDADLSSLLVAAAQYRLRGKSERLRVMIDSTSEDQALFQAVAEALGYRHNKLAMAILAQRCPLHEILSLDPEAREARLFGAAGFLDAFGQTSEYPEDSSRYLRGLWDHWWKIRHGVETSPRRAIHWRLDGTRPLNHPQRRLGALASLLNDWENWRKLWNNSVNNFEKYVNNCSRALSHPYWNHHFTLASTAMKKPAQLIGQARLRDLLGNVIFPSIIRVSADSWSQYLQLRGVDPNQKLRRASLRLFGHQSERQKLFTRFYHQQQGLLQIYEDFCLEDASDCQNCPFPEQLLHWQRLPQTRRESLSTD